MEKAIHTEDGIPIVYIDPWTEEDFKVMFGIKEPEGRPIKWLSEEDIKEQWGEFLGDAFTEPE